MEDTRAFLENLLFNAAIHYRTKEYDAALALYNEAIEAAQQLPSDLYRFTSLRGATFFCLRKYDEALKDYNTVLKAEPLNSCTLVRRGLLLMKTKKYAQALEDLRKALSIEPDNLRIEYLLEELDQKIADLKETEAKIKYPLKRRISEIMINKDEEEDEEAALNFSGLKSIDRKSQISVNKEVLFSGVQSVFEVDQEDEDSENSSVDPGSSKNIITLDKEVIRVIQQQQNEELNPVKLHQSLINQQKENKGHVRCSFKRQDSKSILRNSFLLKVDPPAEPSPGPALQKRLSVLSVKDIDGKFLYKDSKSQLRESQVSKKELVIGDVVDLESAASPSNFMNNSTKSLVFEVRTPTNKGTIQRKSSMRTSSSVLLKGLGTPKYTRKNSSFVGVNIDGKFLSKEKDEAEQTHNLQISQIEVNSTISQSSSIDNNSSITTPTKSRLQRKESILKNKRSECEPIFKPDLKPKRSVVFAGPLLME